MSHEAGNFDFSRKTIYIVIVDNICFSENKKKCFI